MNFEEYRNKIMNDIKMILLQSTKNLGVERSRQGKGLVQVNLILKNRYVMREF